MLFEAGTYCYLSHKELAMFLANRRTKRVEQPKSPAYVGIPPSYGVQFRPG